MDNRIQPKSQPDTDNQIHPKPRPGKLHLMLIIFIAIGLVAGAELLAPRLAGILHGPPSASTATPPEGIQATPAPVYPPIMEELANRLEIIVLIAILLVLIPHIIRRFRLPNTRLIVLSIIIIAMLFFATNEQSDFNKIISTDFKNNVNTNSESSDYQEKISDIKENIHVKIDEIKEDIDSTSLKNVQTTFNKLNDLRTKKGLSQMKWDNRAYEMAVSRSKDMSDRNYFSHLTPEGQCMQTLKSKYGFGPGETVAENIWMISGGAANPDKALTSWMGSPGHNANLFYKDHVKGAIGCYGRYCVFNGVHNDAYGLGAAPCSMYD